MYRIKRIVTISERGSLTENNGTIINGFEIRDLYHFTSKNVPHTISQILRVTEIQRIR